MKSEDLIFCIIGGIALCGIIFIITEAIYLTFKKDIAKIQACQKDK